MIDDFQFCEVFIMHQPSYPVTGTNAAGHFQASGCEQQTLQPPPRIRICTPPEKRLIQDPFSGLQSPKTAAFEFFIFIFKVSRYISAVKAGYLYNATCILQLCGQFLSSLAYFAADGLQNIPRIFMTFYRAESVISVTDLHFQVERELCK
ncbi:hypothetical protein CEXT_605251 [Caerostris extrusa]|uniref:Uncharacterized protein n=1 Tax=Caerostris extrusa TaxID=172846 RepID=A0AAV4Q3Q7_CAEEX|nr:hypothetical protein CEXT_605251 [Caerostris extrusa]